MAWIMNNVGFGDIEYEDVADNNPEAVLARKQEAEQDSCISMAYDTMREWLATQAQSKSKY